MMEVVHSAAWQSAMAVDTSLHSEQSINQSVITDNTIQPAAVTYCAHAKYKLGQITNFKLTFD